MDGNFWYLVLTIILPVLQQPISVDLTKYGSIDECRAAIKIISPHPEMKLTDEQLYYNCDYRFEGDIPDPSDPTDKDGMDLHPRFRKG